jgi:hypothetical protein
MRKQAEYGRAAEAPRDAGILPGGMQAWLVLRKVTETIVVAFDWRVAGDLQEEIFRVHIEA